MVVGATAVVVQVRGDDVSGERFDGLDQVAREMRVAEVEADAEIRQVDIVLDETHQAFGRRNPVRDHFERQPHPQRRGRRGKRLDAAAGRIGPVLGRRPLLRLRHAHVDHDEVRLQVIGELDRARHFCDRLFARALVTRRN